MSKHLPKTTKPLTADQRKVVIDQLRQDLAPVWEKFNENTLKGTEHGITKLSTYLREMENDAYEKRYLMGSLDDYRDKIRTLKFNLKYNGTVLFLRHSPDDIVDLEPRELGLGFVPLSNNNSINSNNSNNSNTINSSSNKLADVEITVKLEKSADKQTSDAVNTIAVPAAFANNLSLTSSASSQQQLSESNTNQQQLQTSLSSNQQQQICTNTDGNGNANDNSNSGANSNSKKKKTTKMTKNGKNLEFGNGNSNNNGGYRAYSPVQKIFEQEVINQKIRNDLALDIALTVDKFKKNISRRIIGKAGGKSMVRCNRCGPRSYVETRSKQTKSADEPETTFCFCTKCERRWRC